MARLAALLVCCAACSTPAFGGEAGSMRWLPGDPCAGGWSDTGVGPQERASHAAEAGLRWAVLVNGAQSRALSDPRGPERVRGLKVEGLTAMYGIHWRALEPAGQDMLCFGVEGDLPLPRPRMQDVVEWAQGLGGVAAFAGAEGKLTAAVESASGPFVFVGFQDGRWRTDCDEGGAWDRLLAKGRKVFVIGGSLNTGSAGATDRTAATWVLARSADEREVVSAVRAGRSFVAEQNAIRFVFTVDGAPPGSTVTPKADTVELGIDATGAGLIDEVRIIGNEAVRDASAERDKTVVLLSFEPGGRAAARTEVLKLDRSTRYIRAVAVSHEGGCRTLTNPVFIGGEESSPVLRIRDLETDENPQETLSGLLETVFKGMDWSNAARTDALLARMLGDRWAGAGAAVYMGRHFKGAQLARIEALLRAGDPQVRALAAYVLACVRGADALDTVLPLLDDEALEPRAYAARLLVRFATPARLDLAERMAHDSWLEVRQYALAALARIPTLASLARLRESLTDQSEAVQRSAAAGLTDMLALAGAKRAEFIDGFRNGTLTANQAEAAVGRAELRGLVMQAAAGRLAMFGPAPGPRGTGTAPTVFRAIGAVAAGGPVRVDGRPDDRAWEGAEQRTGFTLDGVSKAKHATTVRAVYDDRALYLLFQCDEPDPGRMVALQKDTDGLLWIDDSVEWFIVPDADRKAREAVCFHFCVNTLGVRFDERAGKTTWTGGWESAVGVGKDGWVLEVAIPYRVLGVAPPARGRTTWLVNFARHRRVAPEEDSYFQPGDPRNPAHYAELKFQ